MQAQGHKPDFLQSMRHPKAFRAQNSLVGSENTVGKWVKSLSFGGEFSLP